MANKKTSGKTTDKQTLVVDKLIALMEQGTLPWRRKWNTKFCNLISGHSYSGQNPLLCSLDMVLYNYQSSLFVSFNQAKEQDWAIKKGSKATYVRYISSYQKKVQNDDGEDETINRFSTGFVPIFNVDCVDDSQGKTTIKDWIEKNDLAIAGKENPKIEVAEALIESQNATIHFGDIEAYYVPEMDWVCMPDLERFTSSEAFYAVMFHELGHWTGHSSRLNRQISNNRRSLAYAKEELVAELTAVLICSELNIECDLQNHASYLDGWLSALKKDKKFFFEALSQAQKAVNFLQKNKSQEENEAA